jgi:hypothetical protein
VKSVKDDIKSTETHRNTSWSLNRLVKKWSKEVEVNAETMTFEVIHHWLAVGK